MVRSTQQLFYMLAIGKLTKELQHRVYTFFTNSDFNAIAPKPSTLQSIL